MGKVSLKSALSSLQMTDILPEAKKKKKFELKHAREGLCPRRQAEQSKLKPWLGHCVVVLFPPPPQVYGYQQI